MGSEVKKSEKELFESFIQRLEQNIKPALIEKASDGIIQFLLSTYSVRSEPHPNKKGEVIWTPIHTIYRIKLEPRLDENGKLIWTPIRITEFEEGKERARLNIDYFHYEYTYFFYHGGWETWTYEYFMEMDEKEKLASLPMICTNEQHLFVFLKNLAQKKFSLKEIYKGIIKQL